MGAHKGIKWKDKPAKVRYHNSGQRIKNKVRRILRNNGEAFLNRWKAERNIV